MNSNITWYYHWPFPVQLTHLMILTQYNALFSYILTTYPKFLNHIKIFLFLFQEKHIRFMKQFPQQTRSPLERVSPESPWAYLSIFFAHYSVIYSQNLLQIKLDESFLFECYIFSSFRSLSRYYLNVLLCSKMFV